MLEKTPGLINAHDHLHFALFPRLGRGPYEDAAAWARDIQHSEAEQIGLHRRVPKELRLVWGGLRNLLAGVTEVCHHDQPHPIFETFPIRVWTHFGWAHSLDFEEDVAAKFRATPPDQAFVIHLGEGVNERARREVFVLDEMGALTERTVLVHAVGLDAEGWSLVAKRGASVIWCPRSNHFLFGRTMDPPPQVAVALGTDSPITAEGDLLDEIAFANAPPSMVTDAARQILRIPHRPDDYVTSEEVVIAGEVVRSSVPRDGLHLLHIEGRPPAYVRWNIPELVEQTQEALGSTEIRLAGRRLLQY